MIVKMKELYESWKREKVAFNLEILYFYIFISLIAFPNKTTLKLHFFVFLLVLTLWMKLIEGGSSHLLQWLQVDDKSNAGQKWDRSAREGLVWSCCCGDIVNIIFPLYPIANQVNPVFLLGDRCNLDQFQLPILSVFGFL